MAKTNWQDPKTSEIRSTHISGLQEAVGKLEDSIDMDTISEANIPLTEVYISAQDRYRIFQAPEGKRNWIETPAPIVKKNGGEITTGFDIDYGGGAIAFDIPILAGDVVMADATYTIVSTAGSGDMLKSTYDPNNKARDMFAEFTKTVSGLVPAPDSEDGRVLSDDGDWVAHPTIHTSENEPTPQDGKDGDVWLIPDDGVGPEYIGTLTAIGWDNGEQTVAMTGITSATKGVVGLSVEATLAQRESARKAMLFLSGQDTDEITIVADGDIPTVDIPVVLLEVR